MTVMINLTNGLLEGGKLSEKELNTRLQLRNATNTEFSSSNPVLLKGELVAVNDGGDYRLKIGDGTSNFSQLQFLDAPLRTLIEGKANANHTHFTATTGMSGFMSSTDKAKLDGIDNNANNYTHPSYTARNSGLYKITVNSLGHVTAVSSVTKSDITALGIPAEDTNTTYAVAGTTHAGLMSASDKVKLNSIDENANYYVHPSYASRSSNLYRITVNSTGHISTATAVTADYLEDMGLQRRINYSTSEQATGETWWDGWPIYRKTISIGSLSPGTRATFSTGIPLGKFRKLVRLWGTAKVANDNIWNPIPQVDHTDPNCSLKVELESTNAVPYLVIFVGSNRTLSEGYVTIEYTRGN